MSREIIFRGKRTSDGEWVEGHYYEVAGEHYILLKGSLDVDYEIDPATLGQYIGLKDKNGKRIFEGDVVKRVTVHQGKRNGLKTRRKAVVEFVGPGFHLRSLGASGSRMNFTQNIEVVGNISDKEENK